MVGELTDFTTTRVTLFERIVSAPALYQAWRKVRANRGAAGVDAVSLQVFEERLYENLRELSRSLTSGTYQPMPARFVTVRKDDGRERELAILTVRDRVAQRAVLDAVEPLVEPLLLDCSFAFRQGRNVEMAIQQMLAARANGFWWTVESDVEDFFGSIDRQLLLRELAEVVTERKVLRLVEAWLDAGALEEMQSARASWMRQGREAWASLRLMLSESVNQSLDACVARHLGVGESFMADDMQNIQSSIERESDVASDWQADAQRRTKRAAATRLLQDGAMLAWSQRALLGRLLSAKVLGIGGLAAASFVLAPKALELYRKRFQPQRGTPKGSPISPLLTNFYMTPFDREMTGRGLRLVRYCDDFVIQCRTEAEAEDALRAAEKALAERSLKLHPSKTRIVKPEDEFEFLGYFFAADGRIIPPPTVPEQVTQHLKARARRAAKWRETGR